MRIRLELEPDVATRLKQMQGVRGESLKDLVNHALRLGLRAIDDPGTDTPGRRYTISPVSLGRCRLSDLNGVSEALALVEGPRTRPQGQGAAG